MRNLPVIQIADLTGVYGISFVLVMANQLVSKLPDLFAGRRWPWRAHGLGLALVLVGVLLWAINTYASAVVDSKILTLINVVIMVVVIVWLLRVFGVFTGLSTFRVGP